MKMKNKDKDDSITSILDFLKSPEKMPKKKKEDEEETSEEEDLDFLLK